MLGERPRNGEFEKFFDWPNALTDLPYDSPDVAKIIRELDRDVELQEKTRRANMQHALLRHDWVYRWEAILKVAGVDPLPLAETRKQRLQSLAQGLAQA